MYAAISYGLFRGFLFTSQHFYYTSHLVFGAFISTIILELTILLSLFFLNRYLGDPFYWILPDLRWRKGEGFRWREGKYWRDTLRRSGENPRAGASLARNRKLRGFDPHSPQDM